MPGSAMDMKPFGNTSSPDTIDVLNEERLRRSEAIARGWRRNLTALLLLVVMIVGGYVATR